MKFSSLLIFIGLAIGGVRQACAAESDAAVLTLAQAESLWQQHNFELHGAFDQLDAAEAGKLTAAQRPNPQLSYNMASLHRPDNSFPHGTDSIARIDQVIERGDKRNLRMRAAGNQTQAAREDLNDMRRRGLVTLRQTFYDVLAAQEISRIARESAEFANKQLESARIRLRSGDIAKADFARIEVDALRAANDEEAAQNGLLQAQTALAYLLGQPDIAAHIVADANWPAPAASKLAPVESDVEARSDVAAAKHRVDAAEAALDGAMALRTRDITVGFQVEHNGTGAPLNSVGVGISVPLMTGYEYDGEIAKARADLNAANNTLEQTRAQARGEMLRLRSDLNTATNQIARYDGDLLAAAQRALQAAEFGYTHGALALTDLLDARRVYKATQIEAINARDAFAHALASWELIARAGDATVATDSTRTEQSQ